MRKTLLFLAILLLAALPTFADSAISGRAGRAEVRFLEGMIDHHQMALDMAADCLSKTSSDALKTLCQSIQDAQSGEIAMMQGWLKDWYNVDYAPTPMTFESDSMAGMAGMNMAETDPSMTMGMMAGLTHLTGRDYDTAWIEAMIDHHDDALHMSERILRYSVHDEVRALASTIIHDQAQQIQQMEAMLSSGNY